MEFPPITPSRRVKAQVEGLFVASDAQINDAQGFVSSQVAGLDLDFEGIPGERHVGFTRPADARVPWYKRGTVIRNVRHVSLVSVEELAQIADLMGLSAIQPEWLGANIVLAGLPRLSFLPTGSRLFFAGGAVLAAEGVKVPPPAAAAHPDAG